MKTFAQRSSLASLGRIGGSNAKLIIAFAILPSLQIPVSWADTAKTFATPDEAVTALVSATTVHDSSLLRSLFGPAGEDLENPDRVQSTNEFNTFTAEFNQTNRLARLSDTQYVLEVGADLWPFPVPIVKKDGRWYFDAEVGKDELLGRRIGHNELAALVSVRAYVDAQREYALKDHDGDEVLEYAQRISSSPGKTDGLYWPSDLTGEVSPIGPLVAEAQAEGYFGMPDSPHLRPQPFHGYWFKILTRQGSHPPGGKFDYLVNGNMILGYALVAWPAEYGNSGVMTFVVNQQGRVYEKDLGINTAKIVKAMRAYDPDRTWRISPD